MQGLREIHRAQQVVPTFLCLQATAISLFTPIRCNLAVLADELRRGRVPSLASSVVDVRRLFSRCLYNSPRTFSTRCAPHEWPASQRRTNFGIRCCAACALKEVIYWKSPELSFLLMAVSASPSLDTRTERGCDAARPPRKSRRFVEIAANLVTSLTRLLPRLFSLPPSGTVHHGTACPVTGVLTWGCPDVSM